MKKLMVVLMGLIFLSGCASIFTQTTQRVEVQADPADSKISINGALFQSPGSAILGRGIYESEKHIIKVEKDDYLSCEYKTRGRFNGWFIGNILIGGLIGMGIDLATGAVSWIAEEYSYVVLYKDKICDIYFKINGSQAFWYKYNVMIPPSSSSTYFKDVDGTWKAGEKEAVVVAKIPSAVPFNCVATGTYTPPADCK